MRRARVWAFLLLCLTPAACLPLACHKPEPQPEEPDGPVWFEDVTEKVGLDFVHDPGPVLGDYFMPEMVGSGAALFDFDGDGLIDIYLLQNAGPKSKSTNRLYRQFPRGRFTDVSKGSGLDIAGFGMGVAIGDVNNDGRPDVLVTEYGAVHLFLNNKDHTFTDVTKEAGLDCPHWGTSAAFLDYDRDGWLDLVLVVYIDYDPSWHCSGSNGEPDYCGPKSFNPKVSKLYRNLGRQAGGRVRFQDVSLASGVGVIPGPGLGVVCADFTGDGWPDIFIANDGKPNHLWVNRKNGTFKEEAVQRGLAYNAMGNAEANMGIGWGDVDGDGLQDIFVTHLNTETNTLWRQGPPGLFRDVTTASGMSSPRWRATGFGTMLADFDNDGALDAAVVNGRVVRAPPLPGADLGPYWSSYGDRHQLFRNDGKGDFLDLSPSNPAVCGRVQVGRGLAVADIDGDGALDLLVTAVADRARLYRNVAPNRGHWLMVRAVEPDLKRDAYCADVIVRAGPRRWIRTVNPAGSYLCSNDARAHFGLGTVDRVEAIEVRWPDGSAEVFDGTAPGFAGGAIDRVAVLEKGKGRPQK
jgi:hypothetical protein